MLIGDLVNVRDGVDVSIRAKVLTSDYVIVREGGCVRIVEKGRKGRVNQMDRWAETGNTRYEKGR